MTSPNNHINYIEFKSSNLEETKKFYTKVFNWSFTDYGPTYSSFEGAGVSGGFEFTKEEIRNGVLVVIVHQDLLASQQQIVKAGGKITVDIFSFPGGERFQFLDPSGNELSVWKEV